MFAVIYRSFVFPHKEDAYQKAWKTIASYFMKEKGALGSTLHKAEDGSWVAYSRWPSKALRDSSWSKDACHPPEIQKAVDELISCLDDVLPEICMDIVESLPS